MLRGRDFASGGETSPLNACFCPGRAAQAPRITTDNGARAADPP
jgi:hypothetical protein